MASGSQVSEGAAQVAGLWCAAAVQNVKDVQDQKLGFGRGYSDE